MMIRFDVPSLLAFLAWSSPAQPRAAAAGSRICRIAARSPSLARLERAVAGTIPARRALRLRAVAPVDASISRLRSRRAHGNELQVRRIQDPDQFRCGEAAK